jgi:hypothetical protein
MGIGSGGIGQKLTASGGITPEQASLAQYHLGQADVQDMNTFSQIPHSTNLTQAIGGNTAGAVKEAGQTSQSNAATQAAFLNAENKNLVGGIGGALGSIAGKNH